MPDNVKHVVYKELSYQIMAAAFDVHNNLGPGFLEKVYENALLMELSERKIKAIPQKELIVYYKDHKVGIYAADIVVNDEIILELKAVDSLIKFHDAQLLNYLKCTGLKLGILINFGSERLEFKRLVF